MGANPRTRFQVPYAVFFNTGPLLAQGVAVCGFSSVVAKSAIRTHSDSDGHESWLQEWSTPLNGAVLGVQRHSKASDATLEHCRDPLAQRGRMSGLVRDMLTR